MDAATIKSALADVSTEKDQTVKSLKLASLCSALWSGHGVDLVVVGGSAIELLTEGAYASGDLDLCHVMLRSAGPWQDKLPMNSGSKVPSIPIEGSLSYVAWLQGRRYRREISKQVAPGVIRRRRSSSDRRLRRLFKGERGMPFTPTEKL
ncbi:MAG TPA: hypothetical protein VJA21_13805 [Verrucomicrobiae bacterium]